MRMVSCTSTWIEEVEADFKTEQTEARKEEVDAAWEDLRFATKLRKRAFDPEKGVFDCHGTRSTSTFSIVKPGRTY